MHDKNSGVQKLLDADARGPRLERGTVVSTRLVAPSMPMLIFASRTSFSMFQVCFLDGLAMASV